MTDAIVVIAAEIEQLLQPESQRHPRVAVMRAQQQDQHMQENQAV
jgi:hypothetical protein